jgi:hypothetical protein
MRMIAAVGVVMFGLSSGPLAMAPETWTNVALVDTMCARKVAEKPDAHTKDCAIKCAGSGFGILLEDGTLLKLDKAGNEKALAALKASEKTDGLRVTVTGDLAEDTITVKTIELQK